MFTWVWLKYFVGYNQLTEIIAYRIAHNFQISTSPFFVIYDKENNLEEFLFGL